MTVAGELAEASRVLGAQVVFFPMAQGAHAWGALLLHAGRFITVRYAPDHPFSPPWVYVAPQPRNPHYYVHAGEAVARLCWCRPEQWDPTFHLLVALGSGIRFVNEL